MNAGGGNVTVTLSIKEPTTKVSAATTDGIEGIVYTLYGTLVQTGTKGVVIEKGRKIIR